MIINNNKLHNCNLELKSEHGRYEFCLKNEQNDRMGFVIFRFDEEERCVWLQKIQTEKRFQQRLGVGNVLICAMEHFAIKNRYREVAGTYNPSNEYVLPFYLKNGYFVPNQDHSWDIYDETWRLSKTLDPEDVERRYKEIVLGQAEEKSEKQN